jgi:hypothetical protein
MLPSRHGVGRRNRYNASTKQAPGSETKGETATADNKSARGMADSRSENAVGLAVVADTRGLSQARQLRLKRCRVVSPVCRDPPPTLDRTLTRR